MSDQYAVMNTNCKTSMQYVKHFGNLGTYRPAKHCATITMEKAAEVSRYESVGKIVGFDDKQCGHFLQPGSITDN
jgi:hypothetical protein